MGWFRSGEMGSVLSSHEAGSSPLPASEKYVLTMPAGVPNTQVRSDLNVVRARPRQPDHSSCAVLRFPNNPGVRAQRAQLGGTALADCFVRLR